MCSVFNFNLSYLRNNYTYLHTYTVLFACNDKMFPFSTNV